MNTGQTPGSRPEADETRAELRRALRRECIERRMALPPGQHEALSKRLCELIQQDFPELSGKRVAFCWPFRNEPDLLPLMKTWLAGGKPGFAALLPVVVDAESPLAFRAWTPETPMLTDRYGIPAPASGKFLPPDALLIPVNAFDGEGYRLGYGGGFFDRTLASLDPLPLAIGVSFELARVESIHPEAHDMRLDAVVSEAGVFVTVRTD